MKILRLIYYCLKICFRYTTADKFYFEPTINPTEVLIIDRITGEAEVRGNIKNTYYQNVNKMYPILIYYLTGDKIIFSVSTS